LLAWEEAEAQDAATGTPAIISCPPPSWLAREPDGVRFSGEHDAPRGSAIPALNQMPPCRYRPDAAFLNRASASGIECLENLLRLEVLSEGIVELAVEGFRNYRQRIRKSASGSPPVRWAYQLCTASCATPTLPDPVNTIGPVNSPSSSPLRVRSSRRPFATNVPGDEADTLCPGENRGDSGTHRALPEDERPSR